MTNGLGAWRALSVVLCAASWAGAADFRAGLAAEKITPREPVRLSGYAGRKQPSQGVVLDLWAKALVLEDRRGRFAFVTMDLITIPVSMANHVAERVKAAHGIPRERLLLNCSHTHAGPVLRPNLHSLPEVDEAGAPAVEAYTKGVEEALVRVVAAALADLKPARLEVSHATAPFATNRREASATGIKIGVNPAGPADRDVPVIAVKDPQGGLRAVVFGYACHPTTTGSNYFQISGDYAGFAQAEIERRHPGARALFLQLCGADQNPYPRGTAELAREHGNTLAAAVETALGTRPRRLRVPLRSSLVITQLEFQPHTRETFTARLNDSNATRAAHARRMLANYDAGRPIRSIDYPVHAVRFGKDLTLIALGGEVVVDYALRAKRELRGEDLVVAGYSNDVMCYIPSVRVLREGGYEAVASMLYDGMPMPFAESVEERIFEAIRKAVRHTGRRVQ